MSSIDNPTLGDNLSDPTEDSPVAQMEEYLTYIIPSLITIVLPFSLCNVYLLNLANIIRHWTPSHLLYLNLLSTDILTTLGGIFVVIHIKYKDNISFWLFKNLVWLSFYTAVPLLFGLVTIRILSRHLELSKWLSYGQRIAKIVAVLSWSIGLGVATLHDCFEFGRVGSVIKNILVICVGILTSGMNLYVWITLKRVRLESRSVYKATVTALFLFLNFKFYCAYATAVNIFSIYTHATGSSACSASTWVGLLLCSNEGRHELGNCLMMLHGIGNNLILVSRNVRMVRIVVQYHVRKVRSWFSRDGGGEGQPLLS